MPKENKKQYTGYGNYVAAKEAWKSYPARVGADGYSILVEGVWMPFKVFETNHPEPRLRDYLKQINYKGENACTRMANIA